LHAQAAARLKVRGGSAGASHRRVFRTSAAATATIKAKVKQRASIVIKATTEKNDGPLEIMEMDNQYFIRFFQLYFQIRAAALLRLVSVP
jgi:hypothetical protein